MMRAPSQRSHKSAGGSIRTHDQRALAHQHHKMSNLHFQQYKMGESSLGEDL